MGIKINKLNGELISTNGGDGELPANTTLQGNTFNGPNQLVKTNAAGLLPALDGSNLTNLPLGGENTSYKVYNIKTYGAVGDGVLHPVSEWLVGGVRDKGYADLAAIQVDYPAVTALTDSIDWAAWEKAKSVIPAEGGTLYLPNGIYFGHTSSGWRVHRHNLQIEGETRNGVILTVSDTGSAVGLELSGYRSVGWDRTEEGLVPYTDEMSAGQGFIQPKDPADIANFPVGTTIFINAGASYYDQEFGEFNIVQKVDEQKIYLKWNLGRGYSLNESTYSGTVLADFTPPVLQADVVATIDSTPNVGQFFSIGNDLYKVISKDVNNNQLVTIRNVKSTNSTALIPTGTKCYKHRAIFKTPLSSVNTTVKNISIHGRHNAIRISNSVTSFFDNVYFKWLGRSDGDGGIWLDGDDGRNAHFVNCEFDCYRPFGSQPARSFTDMSFRNCKFIQAGIHFSEFNHDCEVMDSKFYIHNRNKTERATLKITSGATASADITVTLSGVNKLVSVIAGDTIIQVADKIRATTYSGWTVAGVSGKDTIIFKANSAGDKTNATFNPGTTGVTGDITTLAADADLAAVSLGWTTSNIRVHDNEIFIEDMSKAIDTYPDVLGYNSVWRGGISVKDNTIHMKNGGAFINVNGAGSTEVSGNKMFGSAVNIMAVSGWNLAEGTGTTTSTSSGDKFVMGSHAKCHHNTFIGYCDGLSVSDITNAEWEDNYFHMIGEYTSGGNSHIRNNGNIIFHSGEATTRIERVVFRNNTFKGWYYLNNSINFKYPISNRVDISNNRFIDNTGPDRLDKDFIITLHDEERVSFGSLDNNALIKSPVIDWSCYADLVRNAGGSLTAAEITAGKKALKAIYDHKLRDKVVVLYPMLGDAKASRVPLLGWEKTIYKSFPIKNYGDAAYTKTTGWKGDGLKTASLVKTSELDFSDFGLFTQITNAGTVTGEFAYVGIYGGNTSTMVWIRKNGTSILNGLGGATINSSYSPDTGFILSSQKGTDQLNYIDTVNKVNLSNTAAGATLNSAFTSGHLDLFGTGSGRLSDAGVGSVGIIKKLTLSEAEILRSIIGQLMLDLGRPAQRASFELPSPLTENKGISTQSGDGALTTFTIAHGLSTAPSYYSVQAGSADASGISYITADATNLTVNYSAAPVAGTDNLKFVWNVNK